MIKILKNIIEVFFIALISYFCLSVFQKAEAASVSVSSTKVNMGETTAVTVGIPDGYVAYEGTVAYDTGKLSSTGNSGTIKVADANFNLDQVSNFTVNFTAISEGTANVSVNLTLCKSDGSTEAGTGSGTITIIGNTVSESSTDSSQPIAENKNPVSIQTPEVDFNSVNETVYATQSMNVRSSWSKNSDKVGYLDKGQAVTRTGTASNGWSRIIYNGNVAYVASSLVTTENPEETVEEPETEEVEETEIQEEPEEQTEEELNEEIYQEIVSKVGTIPEVGKNYNIYLFLGICLLSIISFIFITNNKKV